MHPPSPVSSCAMLVCGLETEQLKRWHEATGDPTTILGSVTPQPSWEAGRGKAVLPPS